MLTIPLERSNEAINGFVNLSGEFKVPGDYSFSSSETLQ